MFPDSEKRLWVDFDKLVGESYEDEEPYLYQGKRFDGMAIEMDGHFCVREMFLDNGKIRGESNFSYSGKLVDFQYYDKPLSQTYHWAEDGTLLSVRFQVINEFRVEFDFRHGDQLKSANINGDYFTKISKYKNKMKFPIMLDRLDFSKNACIYNELSLSSKGITDAVLDEMGKCDGFEKLNSIILFHTMLSDNQIEKLGNIPTLENIMINDHREELINVAKRLKTRKENCQIIFNDEEVS